jgi:hypothetical protein
LELKSIEVLLSSFFRPVFGPALALERIESQVDQERHVNMGLFPSQPYPLVNGAAL